MMKQLIPVRELVLEQPVKSIRLMSLLVILIYVALDFIFIHYLPTVLYSRTISWSITSVVTLFALSTYLKQITKTYKSSMSLVLFYTVLGHWIYLTLANNYHFSPLIILILVIGGGTIILNNMYLYYAQSGAILLLTIAYSQGQSWEGGIIVPFLDIVFTIATFGVVLWMRLQVVDKLKFSHEIFNKLNILTVVANKSGKVLYVSPSVKILLGFEPADLLGDRWWKKANLKNSWIPQQVIIDYPNFLHNDVKSMEQKMKDIHGNTLWLKWDNSILPDGNYLGVGINITPYKGTDSSN